MRGDLRWRGSPDRPPRRCGSVSQPGHNGWGGRDFRGEPSQDRKYLNSRRKWDGRLSAIPLSTVGQQAIRDLEFNWRTPLRHLFSQLVLAADGRHVGENGAQLSSQWEATQAALGELATGRQECEQLVERVLSDLDALATRAAEVERTHESQLTGLEARLRASQERCDSLSREASDLRLALEDARAYASTLARQLMDQCGDTSAGGSPKPFSRDGRRR
jgi:hypothetical protein